MGSSLSTHELDEFKALTTRQELAAWLGISDGRLRYILYRLRPEDRYFKFHVKKRNGGHREIEAPHAPLKQLQRRVHEAISVLAPPAGLAKGFVSGRTIVDHARLHSARRWIVLADISEFFPSIHFGRVMGALMAAPLNLPREVALPLAQLCCNGRHLPQGSPASPSLSNLICRSLDHELLQFARSLKCSVSRYADDICFSSNIRRPPASLAKLVSPSNFIPGDELIALLNGAGFNLNPSKFRVFERRDRQLVTGLVVNRGVGMPRPWRRQLRVMLHLDDKHGDEEAKKICDGWEWRATRRSTASETLEPAISGKAAFAAFVEKKCRKGFVRSLYRAYPRQRALLPAIEPTTPLRIMSEGASDLLHFEAALAHFRAKGEFLDVRPRFDNLAGDSSDEDLLKSLRSIAKVNVGELTIGVFDCDNEAFMRRAGLGPGSMNQLGDKVFAVCLSPPAALVGHAFCIESLYDRLQATQFDGHGRRLFFGDEFDPATGLTPDGNYERDNPRSRSLVVSGQVLRVADRASVLMSKVDFGKAVQSGVSPFDSMSYEGFIPTLKVIQRLVHDQERRST